MTVTINLSDLGLNLESYNTVYRSPKVVVNAPLQNASTIDPAFPAAVWAVVFFLPVVFFQEQVVLQDN